MVEISSKKKEKEEVIGEIAGVLGVEFSEDQVAAIVHFGKPLNILSCAGSGKTTTLIGKMLFMEMYYEVSPVKMLAITFNREAIDDMEERYTVARRGLGLNRHEKVTFRTYHSLYHLILSSKFTDYMWKGMSEYTRYTFKLQAACRKNLKKYDDDTLSDVMSIRGYQINNMLSFEELTRTPKFLTSGIEPVGYQRIIEEYELLKKSEERIDFDDLQDMMYKDIKENPKVLEVVHSAWDYFIVDEYQDISKVQLEILKEMVKDTKKLTAVGDEDQSIYEFRGSKSEYIVDFNIHFMGADRVVMGTNYRVPENILVPVTYSIKNNKNRVSKEMKAHKQGGELKYTMSKGMVDSAVNIADEIEKYYLAGKSLNDIVILIRNNKQQRVVLDALLEKDIPVSAKSDMRVTNHFITRDLKSIVELALDPTDHEAFKRVFTKIAKFVKRALVNEVSEKMREESKSWRDYLINFNNPQIHEASSMLYGVAELVKGDETYEKVVEAIQPLYREFLRFMVNSYGHEPSELGDVLEYVKYVGRDKTFERFYKEGKRKDSLKRYFETMDENTVTISTMHRMKGLEYDRVYLLDLTENVLPNMLIEHEIREKYGDKWAEEYVEQERRLFYVAWTRAKEYLNVMVNQDNPSRFILETIQQIEQPES